MSALRRPRLPEEVAALLEPRERPLATARTADHGWLVGTRDALVVCAGGHRVRLPWERVQAADWDREHDRLVVTEVGEYGRPRPSYAVEVSEPGHLLTLVRERVTASVLLQRRTDLAPRRGFVVIARRPPSGGAAAWMVEYDAGVDPEDEGVQAAVAAALDLARVEVGDQASG